MKINIYRLLSIIITIINIFLSDIKCQTENKTWIIGGINHISFYKENVKYPRFDRYDMNILKYYSDINIGYFIFNDLSIGLKSGIDKIYGESTRGDGSMIIKNGLDIFIGPFIRYYIGNTEKKYNLVIEGSFQTGKYEKSAQKSNYNRISFLFGPEFYLNETVGIELMIGYKKRLIYNPEYSYILSNDKSGFYFNLNFIFHLSKQ